MLTLDLINPIPSIIPRHNPTPLATHLLLPNPQQLPNLLIQLLPVMFMLHVMSIVYHLRSLVAYAVDLRYRGIGQDLDQAVFGGEDWGDTAEDEK